MDTEIIILLLYGICPMGRMVEQYGDLVMTYSVFSSTAVLENEIASDWKPVCHITYTRDTWVKLLRLPNEYAFDEAKLLCQESSDSWIAWVPDHGEVLLDRSDFYC